MDIITLRLLPVIRRFPNFRFQNPYYFVDQQFRAAAGGFRLVDRAADFVTDCFVQWIAFFREIIIALIFSLPKMDALKKSRRELAEKKKALYAEYRKAQAQMQEAMAVEADIDYLFGQTHRRRADHPSGRRGYRLL
jgi:hypothetical protein